MTKRKTFSKIETKDFNLKSIQDKVANTFQGIFSEPCIWDGNLVTISASSDYQNIDVYHGLKRIPSQYLLVGQENYGSVKKLSGFDPSNQYWRLQFQSSGSYDIWFF